MGRKDSELGAYLAELLELDSVGGDAGSRQEEHSAQDPRQDDGVTCTRVRAEPDF